MQTLSGFWKFSSILVTGLAVTVSAIYGDEPRNQQTDTDSDQTATESGAVAGRFSLITHEGSLFLGNLPAEQLSEFWIGVSGNPIDDVLRLHLGLPETQGMLITEVIDDSPASKAGLKANDVLVAAGEKLIKESADLSALIAEKKEVPLPIRLIREGKPIIIEVTPARRPATQTGETCPAISKADDSQFINRVYLDLTGAIADAEKVRLFVEDKEGNKREKLVNRLLRNSTTARKSCVACHSTDVASMALSRQLLGFHLRPNDDANHWTSHLNPSVTTFILNQPHPGVMLTDGTITQRIAAWAGLPDDVTITITRKGQSPTQITVRRGEQIWDATADDYQAKLPEEIRPYVARWLTGGGEGQDRSAIRLWLNAGQANADVSELSGQALRLQILDGQTTTTAKVDDESARLQIVEKELESLNQQLLQIQQSLEKVRKGLHGSPELQKK